MIINPLTATDFYKTGHIFQYPEGTTEVYSNLTARSSKLSNLTGEITDVVFFGLQYFLIDFLQHTWRENFFDKSKREVIEYYERRLMGSIGHLNIEHIGGLHDLGYLPLLIKSIPEGSRVPIGVPMLTIKNTHPDFFWLTNYIETTLSSILWKPITSATTAFWMKRFLHYSCLQSQGDYSTLPFQAHDFSFRGMSGVQDAALSGAAHLTSFKGTDTIAAIDLLEKYYMGDGFHGVIGASVPATEHSVMCCYGQDGEFELFKRLITEVYPTGIISIVSDSWDFFKVLTEYLPKLKDEILNRNGKVVIRPDSGDPLSIICGIGGTTPEGKGALRILDEIFGMPSDKIGLIYGDSISPEKMAKITNRIIEMGFPSTSVVFGVGSYTYQYVTRDTYGIAMKATSAVVNGKRISLFKDPKTDYGIKKSAKGLLKVKNGVLYEDVSEYEESKGDLKVKFLNGSLFNQTTLYDIRDRLDGELL